MSLQSIPILTRDQENEMQLYLAWEYIEWINDNFPEIYEKYVKSVK